MSVLWCHAGFVGVPGAGADGMVPGMDKAPNVCYGGPQAPCVPMVLGNAIPQPPSGGPMNTAGMPQGSSQIRAGMPPGAMVAGGPGASAGGAGGGYMQHGSMAAVPAGPGMGMLPGSGPGAMQRGAGAPPGIMHQPPGMRYGLATLA